MILARSGAWNSSGKRVTTLIVSIGPCHGDEVVAPGLHGGARRDPHESQQPLAVVGASPRHDQWARDDLPLFVHHVQLGLRSEHGTRIGDQGDDRHFPPLSVRLPRPPPQPAPPPPPPPSPHTTP